MEHGPNIYPLPPALSTSSAPMPLPRQEELCCSGGGAQPPTCSAGSAAAQAHPYCMLHPCLPPSAFSTFPWCMCPCAFHPRAPP